MSVENPNGLCRISVVIPTYRRPDLLSRCLAALGSQSLDHSRFEVIVADDAAEPRIQQLVRGIAGQAGMPRLVYVPVKHRHGPAAARNQGWWQARGEIIAFTDDDTIPEPNWLAAVDQAFQDGVDAGWGKLIMPLPPSPTDYEYNAAQLADAPFVTANCFCRRLVLESVGGFDERFGAAWREDSDLWFRLLEQGHRIVLVPEARVAHPIRPAAWGVSLSQLRKTIYDALLYKKHPDYYRERIGSAPWDYYLIVAGLLLAIASQSRHSWGGIATGWGIWLSLTAAFLVRRLRRTSRRFSHVLEMVVTSILIPPLAIYYRLLGAAKFRVGFL
jgi:GT2 family glycosyltransferase